VLFSLEFRCSFLKFVVEEANTLVVLPIEAQKNHCWYWVHVMKHAVHFVGKLVSQQQVLPCRKPFSLPLKAFSN
jgi:hypothetical protein